ncbi:MAG: biopolymer transporter ExbD [Gammaproteobacteria bacterium]|nr:biopolymer transporter ExbD [Gammaproteobacteria bacterium]
MLANTEQPSNLQDSSIIPLINVVFLILIFLIITGQLMESDIVDVDIPESLSESIPPEEPLTLIVTVDSEIYFENARVDSSEIRERIKDSRDENTNTPPDVLIKADGKLPVSSLQPILESLREAQLQKVTIATLQRTS